MLAKMFLGCVYIVDAHHLLQICLIAVIKLFTFCIPR